MKTEFFATRTLARNFANENAGKTRDFGKDAETGKRWAVEFESIETPVVDLLEAVQPAKVVHAESTANLAAALKAVEVAKPVPNVKDRISFLNTNNIEKSIKAVAEVAVKEVKKIIAGIIGEEVLITQNNKRVRVLYRRPMMPVRLAMSIAKSA